MNTTDNIKEGGNEGTINKDNYTVDIRLPYVHYIIYIALDYYFII